MLSRSTPRRSLIHSPSLASFAPVALHLPSICVDSIFLKTNRIAKIPMHKTRPSVISVLRIKNHSPNSPIRLIRNPPSLHPFVPFFQLNCNAIEPRSAQRPPMPPSPTHMRTPAVAPRSSSFVLSVKPTTSPPIPGDFSLLGFGLGTTRSSCPGCTVLNTNLHRFYQKVFSAFLALSAVKCKALSLCSPCALWCDALLHREV